MKHTALPLVLFASGCIAQSEAAPIPARETAPAQRSAQAAAGATAVTGHITWHGAHPALAAITATQNTAGCPGSFPSPALRIGADNGVGDTVVLLLSTTNPPTSASSATIDQQGCSFSPHVSVIQRGGRLTFANHDTVLHSVHAFRDATSEFNLATPPNLSLSHNVNDPGLLRLQCDVGHNWMFGYVYVSPTPYVALTDAHGSFHIPNVPAGTYTMRVWHEGWTPHPSPDGHPNYGAPVVINRTVTVPASGTFTADVVLNGS